MLSFLLYLIVLTMNKTEVSRIIVDFCCQIHVELGLGLLESVYYETVYHELKNEGWVVER